MTEHDTTLAVEDRLAIHELMALHGHLVDDGAIGEVRSVTSSGPNSNATR